MSKILKNNLRKCLTFLLTFVFIGAWFFSALPYLPSIWSNPRVPPAVERVLADPSDPWWDSSFLYRIEAPVYYSGSETLTQYQIMVDNLDTASLIANSKMRTDCGDIRFTSDSGDVLPYTIVGNTCNTSDTEIWAQTNTLATAATTTFYMYYGNAATTSEDSIVQTFSYSEMKTVGYPLNPASASMGVITLEPNNTVGHNDSTSTLTNVGDTTTISSPADYSPVKATKLFNMSDNNYDVIAPVSWAGTEFIYRTRTSSYTEYFVLVSPWGTATVNIYAAGAACGTNPRTVTSAGLSATDCAIGNSTQYRITSDIPIIANKSNHDNDPLPLHPATADPWYGWDSNQSMLGAGPNGANYVKIDSNDSSTSTGSLGANGGADLGFDSTSYYGGEAGQVYSEDYPIGIMSAADSDGGDATTWVPRYEFGTKFGSAFQTDFVAVVSDQTAGCTTFTAAGASQHSATTTSSNNEVYRMPDSTFGIENSSVYINGAWYIECNKPVYVISQDTDDEQNMFSYPMMRQFTYPTPVVGVLGQEEEEPVALSWDTGAADFEIFESGSLSWDAGTLVCSGTLTNNNDSTIDCEPGTIDRSTQYRVQVVLENEGASGLNMSGAGDFVEHKNVQTGWAGTSPSLGSCGFNDIDGDNGSTSCNLAFNGNDVRITNTGGGNVVLAATTGSEGFMYIITTDSDAQTDSTSYMDTSIDANNQDSSKITIPLSPDLEQVHFRWRYDSDGEGNNPPWWNTDWDYRKKITLSGATGAGADYQVELIVGYSSGGDFNCGSNCQTDFDDIRFTDDDGITLLEHWREEYTDSSSAVFWVKVADDLGSSQDIYIYYGESSTSTASNATSTFLFWDDFYGASLNSSRWDEVSGSPPATYSVHDGYLSMWDEWGGYCSGSGVYNRLNTQTSFSPPIAVESRFSVSGSDSIGNTNICYHTILGNRDVVGLSNGATYGNIFRIDTNYTGYDETFPAKDTWYRTTKIFETGQLRAITGYGVDNTYSGSVISSGVIGLSGDTDADLETSMTDRVDWVAVRKYINSEPDFSSASSQESYSTGAAFIFAEDVGFTDMETATTTRLRFAVSNEAGQTTSTNFQIEYAKTNVCSSSSYTAVPADYSADWHIATSTFITDGQNTYNISPGLTDPGSQSFVSGELKDASGITGAISLTSSQFTELEYALWAVPGNAEAGANYCFRLTSSGSSSKFTYTTYATTTIVVGASPPVASSVSIDSGAEYISLVASSTQNVVCAGIVTDANGYEDITSVEAKLYRTSIGHSASDDNNNHYTLAGDSQCAPSGGSGNTENYTCTFAVYYYVDGTDSSSAYESDDWTCRMMPSDGGGEGAADTDTIEMYTLLSLAFEQVDIDFSAMNPGEDTGAVNQIVNIVNTGNVRIDVEFDGYGSIDGDGNALDCVTGAITVASEKYGASDVTYASLSYELSDTAVERDWDIIQRTNDSAQVQGEDKKYSYWGLAVPMSCNCIGACSGYTIFTAVNDAGGD